MLRAIAFVSLAAVAAAEVAPGELLVAEMNCAACHAASPELSARLFSRPAPRLGEVPLTAKWVREFLADPQKTKPGTLMPDTLHGLPPEQKPAAVEALTHFVISLQPPQPKPAVGASPAKFQEGERLFHEVGCMQCHAPAALPESRKNDAAAQAELAALVETSVPLAGPGIARKYTVEALGKFLADPLKSRPGGRMPSLNLTGSEAESIAAWLLREQADAGDGKPATIAGLRYDYYEKDLPELPQFERLQPTASGVADVPSLKVAKRKNGFALRFRGNVTVPKAGRYKFYSESDDGSRIYIGGRLLVDNGGIHPAQPRGEEIDLKAGAHTFEAQYFDGGGNTAFKVQWKGPGIEKQDMPASAFTHDGKPMLPVGDEPFAVDAALAAQGAKLFTEMRCNSCHAGTPVAAAPAPAKDFAALRPRQPAGCLASNPKPGIPKFTITDRQRQVILATLQSPATLAAPLETEQQIRRTMTALNCFACHTRDRRGGADGLRRDYFAAHGETDLGDEGRIPPHLNGAGAKLRPGWIAELLEKGTKVRPYMATRMPAFGKENTTALAALFEKADVAPDGVAEPNNFADNAAADAKWGRKLTGTTGLSCIACHNFAGNKSLGIPALDLAEMSRRLRYDWFRRYMLDPQSLRPGTRMPSFWPGGVAVNKDVLKGDTEQQIRALWLYLARQNFTDLPDGLVQGKMEIAARSETAIYRNFIEGAGPRAIGVGYPEKANFAFDAENLRLALIWQGPFIDAAKHRTGRGAGFEKPLGRNFVKLPSGPAFVPAAAASGKWPAEGAGTFLGYRLDEKQRPIFRYRIGSAVIEDHVIAVPGGADAFFRRTLTFSSNEPLLFRAATGKLEQKGDEFIVDGLVRMKFPGHIGVSIRGGDLIVPVSGGKMVQEIVW